jgi:predicted dehydrogenase
MKSSGLISRRSFIRRSALAGAAIGFPAIIPSSVFGANAPSNRIVMGAIGLGNMGNGNMHAFLGQDDVQFVAVCDVDSKRRAEAKGKVDTHYGNQDCVAYHDFREMLGRGDLDAISLALPDHWHAIPVIAAARLGIDMYGEKPLARSIGEGRAMCNAVHRYGRVWQTGSWQRSVGNFRKAAELVRNGRIGKVHRVEVGLPTGHGCGNNPVQPVPEELDWNFWLGPAPKVPYRGVSHWDWRWVMDYSGGQLTDWAGHHIDIAHWGLGYDNMGPVEVVGKGTYPEDGYYDVPVQYDFTCKYASGIEIRVANSAINPMGTKWIGDKGWIHVDRGSLSAEPANLLNERIGPGEIKLYESPGHQRNFLDCVKSRRKTITPIETAHRSISVGLLGEIAMLTGRKIRWNPEKEEIIGDPAASALLCRSYREPWVL